MTREEAVKEIEKAFEPAFANYIITALTEGATASDKEQETCEDAVSVTSVFEIMGNLMSIPYDFDRNITEKDVSESMDKIRELPRVTPQEPRWIPVTERLPDREEYIANNGRFIVSDGERSYSEYFDIYDKECFGEPTMYGFRVDRVVAAWMPLPKPYEEDKEE